MIPKSYTAIPEREGQTKPSCWKHETVKKMQSSISDVVCGVSIKTRVEFLWLVLQWHWGETWSEVEGAQSFLLVGFVQTKYTSYQEIFYTMQPHRMKSLTTYPSTAIHTIVVYKV